MKKRLQRSDSKALATLPELELLLGHTFARPDLLTLALTHRSFVYDTANHDSGPHTPADLANPARDNEQLEFVGDAALGLLAAEALYRRFSACREGELTRLRASIVSRKYLGAVGTRLDLGRWLRLGHTAEANDARHNAALFANAVEALIAALYLDGGLEAARHFVETFILTPAIPDLERSLAGASGLSGAVGDHKSALQELLQAEGLGQPEYRLVAESGPDHRRIFHVEIHLQPPSDTPPALITPTILEGVIAQAQGPTKKQAQQEAARLALLKLASREPSPEPIHG